MSNSFRTVLILFFCVFVGTIIRSGSCGCSNNAPSILFIFLFANLYNLPFTLFLTFNLFKRFNPQNQIFKTVLWVHYKANFYYLCIALLIPPIHLGSNQKDMELQFLACLIIFTIIKYFFESHLYLKYFTKNEVTLSKLQINEVCSTFLLIFLSGFILKLLSVYFNISLDAHTTLYFHQLQHLKALFFTLY